MTEITDTNESRDRSRSRRAARPDALSGADRPTIRWALLALAPLGAIAASPWLPRWGFLWLMASFLYLGFKALAWPWPFRRRDWRQFFVWVCLWPGMDPLPLLQRQPSAPPFPRLWLAAIAKTLLGAILLWGLARHLSPPLLAGWVGMLGFITLIHFGLFHVAALAWQQHGVAAAPLMRNPLAAVSLIEFWSSRWNRGFSDVARRRVLRPLAPALGLPGALMAVFVFSGVVHELVISVPAGGGYGMPTAYFAGQGLASLWQRAHPRWAGGWRGRLFTLAIVAAPVWWLFPPLWVERCMLPFFHVIHAL